MSEIVIRLPKRLRGVVRLLDDAAPSSNVPLHASPTPAVPFVQAPHVSSVLEQDRGQSRFVETALVGLREAINTIERRRQEQVADWQTAAIELALMIATRLFHQEVSAGRYPLEALVREMVAPYVGSPNLRVYLNPVDLCEMNERLGGQSLTAINDDVLPATADPSLARGDCRVEDGDRVMVAQLAEQLRALREEMLGSFGHEAA